MPHQEGAGGVPATTYLLIVLGIVVAGFIAFWASHIAAKRRAGRADDPASDARPPSSWQLCIGVITDFFDALGIGSFATTTSIFRLNHMVPDRLIPGTLNIGHAIPTAVQAFIYIKFVPVEPMTLICMIAAAVLGSWIGAGTVSRWQKRRVQIGMGCALLVAAVILLARQLGQLPKAGDALALTGGLFWAGIAGNFVLGALMTLGIGLYAPCMILVSLLGMSEDAAFPIMMGSCAFLMPIASVPFVRRDCYALRPALGLALGGIPGVLIAAFIVVSLSLTMVKWLVLVVVVYTAVMMLRSAMKAELPASASDAARGEP